MSQKILMRFKVKNKGGKLAGQVLEQQVPDFDLTKFINLPNADIFIRNAYFSSVRDRVREIAANENGTRSEDIESMESVIARSMNFTQAEIAEWLKNRDWESAKFKDPCEKTTKLFQGKLMMVMKGEHHCLSMEHKNRYAEVVANIADKPSDPIADFFFAKLTQINSQNPEENI